MSDDKSVAVRLTATNDLFKKAMLDAGGSVKGLASTAEAQFKKIGASSTAELGKATTASGRLSTQMMSVGATAAALGAGLIAVGWKMASSFESIGREVLKVQRYTGATAEEASKLRFAAQQSGVDVDKLTKSLGMMARGMANSPQKFEELGIAVRDSSGNLRSTGDVLLDVADKVKSTTNATERLSIAQSAFGRSGADMLPMLMKGRDGIAALEDQAKKYGLVLTQDNLNAVKASVQAHREFDAAVQGLQVSIGSKFLPVVTTVTETLAGLMSGAHGVAGEFVFWGGTGLVVAGGLVMIASKAIAAWQAFMAGTAALRAYAAAEWVAAGGASALAGPLAVVAAAVIAVGYAYKQANDSAMSVLKPEIEVGRAHMLSESYDSLTDHIGRVKGVADDLGDDWNPITRGAEDDVRELQKYGEHLAELADGVAGAAGISADEALKWVQAQAALGHEFDTTGAAISAYTGKVDTTGMTVEDATAAIKAQQQALKDLNDELHASMDPLFAMQRSIAANVDARQKATDAQLAAFFAQNAYNDAVRRYGADSAAAAKAAGELDQANRELSNANMAAASSALDVSTAANTLKFAMDNGSVSVQGAKDQLGQWVAQGLLTEEQAAAVSQSFGWLGGMADHLNTKNPITIGILTPGLAEAFRGYENLAYQINTLDGRTITVTAQFNARTSIYNDDGTYNLDNNPATGGGRARGGPVAAGVRYRVAEEGAELYRSRAGAMSLLTGPMFTPQDSGMIFPADVTRRMLQPAAHLIPAGVGGGGNTTVVHQGDTNVTVPAVRTDASPYEIGKAVLFEMATTR